ncbi:DUF1853 family protein [Winogradskyella bathintestinalis]|uniref:DUF1853 family protein n=1 Tax=Winogradskyella bathintestinalis TaxID=3035208 RepID=A0ABT7ZX83_9FLAO|nr:DUF1853 family protein [Winogradskyella bathintestinalis]MDN3493589.1 DUF1853 family protein [Winogradskyella bathintestinalis]
MSSILRFKGYNNTPVLFNNDSVFEFEQVLLHPSTSPLNNTQFQNTRLGKLVEEFVFFQLKHDNAVQWILENLQIQKGQRTIGELDAVYASNGTLYHLEIVYKFYLYDTLHEYSDPLAYWIGPNRKDTLLYKLDKLRAKQFPLLYRKETSEHLSQLNVDIKNAKQRVCFKAQLFLPYSNDNFNIEPLNQECISGFYLSFNEISTLVDLEFHIPTKLDWLINPHNNVTWLPYTEAIVIIEEHIKSQRSPLLWLKYNNTKLKKCFITWW